MRGTNGDRYGTSRMKLRSRHDFVFHAALLGVSGMYLLLILGLLGADIWYAVSRVDGATFREWVSDGNIRSSISLTLVTCTVSALLSIVVAIPAGYLLSRYRFRGKALVDAIIDIPIVIPPLVVGLSLLILFNKLPPWGRSFEEILGHSITYNVPAVILAQFTVACAFAIRIMRNTFDQISPRTEDVALTLGCSRSRAFFAVVVPEAWRGISTAGTLAWSRAMGEFGPILVFAGAIRGKTEVLSSTVFLEISVGNLEGAVLVSLLMVTIAVVVLVAVRMWDRGSVNPFHHD